MEFSPSIVSGLLMWNRSEKLRDTPVQTEDNNSAGQKIISPLVYRSHLIGYSLTKISPLGGSRHFFKPMA